MSTEQFERKITKIINLIKSDKKLLYQIGEMAKDLITKRTRLGYGVGSNSKEKFAPLKESTIKARKRKQLSPLTRPMKSNLTETAQMVDSIIHTEKHNNTTMKFSNSDAENKATWAHDGSFNREKRIFFDLTDLEKKQILKFIKEYLLQKIKTEI